MNLNIPNCLTIFRILLIPIIIWLFFSSYELNRAIAALLFLIATITDYLDGFFARYMKQQTSFGEFLDPIADKMLVITMLVLLITENNDILFVIPSLIIISREFLIIAIRQRMAEVGNTIRLKVIIISKFKTAIQLISLLFLLYKDSIFNIEIYIIGIYFLQLASVLTLISFFYYIKKSWNVIIK